MNILYFFLNVNSNYSIKCQRKSYLIQKSFELLNNKKKTFTNFK